MPPFRSLFTREREFESRVHTELTERSRERLVSILAPYNNYHEDGFAELADEVGLSKLENESSNLDHNSFLMDADTILALSYVEHVVRALWGRVTTYGYRGSIQRSDVLESIGKIENVIITEGLLWELEADDNRKEIKFKPIESEAMEQIDREVQALAEKDPWSEAIKGYNNAFDRYIDGDFDDVLVKNLYYSIEETLKIICVDLEEWTDNREMSHGNYLDLLRDNGFYNEDGITAPEINELMDSMEKMVSKLGNERKHEHAYHDRTYMTLLIHQVGAYIYFLINRHEN